MWLSLKQKQLIIDGSVSLTKPRTHHFWWSSWPLGPWVCLSLLTQNRCNQHTLSSSRLQVCRKPSIPTPPCHYASDCILNFEDCKLCRSTCPPFAAVFHQFLGFFFFSLCCSGCPVTRPVDPADFELWDPPASSSRVLWLKACTTTT